MKKKIRYVVHGSITYNPKEMEDCFDEIELEPEIMYVEEDYNALRKYFKNENQHHLFFIKRDINDI